MIPPLSSQGPLRPQRIDKSDDLPDLSDIKITLENLIKKADHGAIDMSDTFRIVRDLSILLAEEKSELTPAQRASLPNAIVELLGVDDQNLMDFSQKVQNILNLLG